MDSCSVPDMSAVSSAMIENPFDSFAAFTILSLTTSSERAISSFCTRTDVYFAFLLAPSVWSFRIVSPASILNHSRSQRFPDVLSFPLNAMSWLQQNRMLDRIGNSFSRFWVTALLTARSMWLTMVKSGLCAMVRKLLASCSAPLCQEESMCFLAHSLKALYLTKGVTMNAHVRPRCTGWWNSTQYLQSTFQVTWVGQPWRLLVYPRVTETAGALWIVVGGTYVFIRGHIFDYWSNVLWFCHMIQCPDDEAIHWPLSQVVFWVASDWLLWVTARDVPLCTALLVQHAFPMYPRCLDCCQRHLFLAWIPLSVVPKKTKPKVDISTPWNQK